MMLTEAHFWLDPDTEYVAGIRNGLGFDPVSTAVVVGTATQTYSTLTANKKDPERLAKNAEAYKLAIAGSQAALDFLKYRSGRYGTIEYIPAPINAGPIGGWATDVAKADALRLYNSALAAYGVSEEEATGGDSATSGTTGSGYPKFGDMYPTGVPTGGYTTPGGGAQSLPPVTVTGSKDYMPLVLAGAALMLFGMPKRQRRR